MGIHVDYEVIVETTLILGANDWDILTILSKKPEPVYGCTYFNESVSLNAAGIVNQISVSDY